MILGRVNRLAAGDVDLKSAPSATMTATRIEIETIFAVRWVMPGTPPSLERARAPLRWCHGPECSRSGGRRRRRPRRRSRKIESALFCTVR